MLTEFVVNMVKEFKIELEQFHNDSTTLTLYGEYAEADGRSVRGKPTVVATEGYNKDHRPDLKQLLWILTVSADGAVPVHFKVSDGNTEDSTTHIETWDVLRRLVGSPEFLYVADCKLCTRENLGHIASNDGWFITIMPKSRNEDSLFRDWLQSNKPQWQEVDLPARAGADGDEEVVKAMESPVPDGDGYRLIWVFSSWKRERDFQARKGCIERAFKDLDDLRKKLEGSRCRYSAKGSVAKIADGILAKSGATRWVTYEVDEIVQETFRQERRGRSNESTRWRRSLKSSFRIRVAVVHENIEFDRRCDGIFPLVTNRKDLSLSQVVEAYKRKQPLIETRHHLLKSVLAASPALLKSISRLEALLFAQYVALTVHALIERELRRAMAVKTIRELPLYPESRQCAAPTADRVLELFANLESHHLVTATGQTVQKFQPELTALQRRLLQLLRVSADDFQTR
jgi:transposase